MKKKICLAAIVLLCFGTGEIFANIDNLSNMSVEWIRTGNRNAATDAADIVVYNPGGITELEDGFQVNIGNQTLVRDPKHKYNVSASGKTTEAESHGQDGIDWVLPNLYLTYNSDNWALFGGYYIPGGGAVVDYPNGSYTTDAIGTAVMTLTGSSGYGDDWLEAESVYNTLTFGGAYKINDWVSVALGIRYILVENNIKASLDTYKPEGTTHWTVDIDEKDSGVGFITGINLNITPQLNLGMQYQSRVPLDLKTSVKQDDVHFLGLFTDNERNPRDLPGMLGFGLGYDFSDSLYAEINYSYWFQKDCDWGKNDSGQDISDLAGDAQSAGITVSYRFTPAFLASVGTTYTDLRWKDIGQYYEDSIGAYEVLYTDNWHVGCGIAWTLVDNVVMNLSIARTIWDDKDLTNNLFPVPVPIKTENKTVVAGVGVNVSF